MLTTIQGVRSKTPIAPVGDNIAVDYEEIRRRNLAALMNHLGEGPAAFAKRCGVSAAVLRQLRGKADGSPYLRETGQPHNITSERARQIEDRIGRIRTWMHDKWMDTPHWHDMPASAIGAPLDGGGFIESMERLWPHLTADQRATFESLEKAWRHMIPAARRKRV